MHLSLVKAVRMGDGHLGKDRSCQNTVVRVSVDNVKCEIS